MSVSQLGKCSGRFKKIFYGFFNNGVFSNWGVLYFRFIIILYFFWKCFDTHVFNNWCLGFPWTESKSRILFFFIYFIRFCINANCYIIYILSVRYYWLRDFVDGTLYRYWTKIVMGSFFCIFCHKSTNVTSPYFGYPRLTWKHPQLDQSY